MTDGRNVVRHQSNADIAAMSVHVSCAVTDKLWGTGDIDGDESS